MKQLIPAACLFVLLGADLSTDYSKERTLRIESTTTIEMETTDFSMTIDGEPMEGRGGGFGGGSSKTSRSVVHLDEFLASEKGAPTHVKRSFESLSGSMERMMRDEPMTIETESPLDGVTLEIKVEDGETSVTAIEGDADDALLVGHMPTLDLDALLPGEEAEVGASWEVEGDAVMQALGMQLESVLFPPPAREEGAGEGERRGRRMRGGQGGGSIARILKDAEWETTLELTSDDEDVDGVICAVIEIEFEASGEMPEQERRGGGRDDRFEIEPGAEFARVEGSFEVSLEGKLLVAIEGRHPVSFELEGTLSTEEHTEMTRRDRTMERDTSREYTINRSIQISQEEN